MKHQKLTLHLPVVRTADLARTGKKAGKTTWDENHEVRFADRKDFHRFVKNLDVLVSISRRAPESVYDLSRSMGLNVSNLAKTIAFFEKTGVLESRTAIHRGRPRKTPILNYRSIEIRLDTYSGSVTKARRRLLRIVRRR